MTTLPRPPYSSATHSQPAINVNLSPCNCEGVSVNLVLVEPHTKECAGQPVLIPCPIQRSVTVEVRLGACQCGDGVQDTGGDRRKVEVLQHGDDCHARPIRVTFSVSGETWAESAVDEVEARDSVSAIVSDALPAACRERWALVKALVLGRYTVGGNLDTVPVALLKQRDAVYSAIADMARAESVILQRFAGIDKVHTNRSRRSFQGFAADELAAYVKHLVEQVGVLGVSP